MTPTLPLKIVNVFLIDIYPFSPPLLAETAVILANLWLPLPAFVISRAIPEVALSGLSASLMVLSSTLIT